MRVVRQFFRALLVWWLSLGCDSPTKLFQFNFMVPGLWVCTACFVPLGTTPETGRSHSITGSPVRKGAGTTSTFESPETMPAVHLEVKFLSEHLFHSHRNHPRDCTRKVAGAKQPIHFMLTRQHFSPSWSGAIAHTLKWRHNANTLYKP